MSFMLKPAAAQFLMKPEFQNIGKDSSNVDNTKIASVYWRVLNFKRHNDL